MAAFKSAPRLGSLLVRTLAGIGLAWAFATPTLAASKAERPTVVELFTSQGCSSCPPADAYLGDLAKRKDVIALTFPVDYWDYLGWKDTFASPANSARQRNYALRRGDRQVYTPQMVINGRVHAVGSRRSQVEGKIKQVNVKPDPNWINVDVSVKNDTLMVKAPAGKNGDSRTATLWLALYTDKSKVAIKRGENGGRSITYYNIVRQMIPLGRWSGDAVEIELPKSDVMGPGYDGCVVFLQVNGTGPIIGAAALDDWMGN